MRLVLFASLAILAVSGCGHQPAAAPAVAVQPAAATGARAAGSSQFDEKVLVTPATGLAGKVARVNPQGKFVVLSFSIGHLPSLEQRLNVYRAGLKVGEVRVTGPQLDENVAADIVSGEPQTGDLVRSE